MAFMEEALDRPLAEWLPVMQQRIMERSTYHGIATLKNPLDFWVYQEISGSRARTSLSRSGTSAAAARSLSRTWPISPATGGSSPWTATTTESPPRRRRIPIVKRIAAGR
jgi:hypothetical protein